MIAEPEATTHAPAAAGSHRPWVQFAAPLLTGMLALAINGGVGVILGLLAIPLTLFRTHDPYVATLAPSYGLAIAGASMQWITVCGVLFGLRYYVGTGWLPFPGSRTRALANQLGLGAIIGLAGALVESALVQSIPGHWQGSLLATLGLSFSAAAPTFGALAALIAWARPQPEAPAKTAIRPALGTVLARAGWFAFSLAVLLQGTLAALDLIGRP